MPDPLTSVAMVEGPPQLYCPDCGYVLGLTHDPKIAARMGYWKYTHYPIKNRDDNCRQAGKDFTLPAVRHILTAT